MSKKPLKRLALVAVSALGAGLLSTVALAPAANAASTVGSVSVGTVPAARVGQLVTIPITVNLSANGGSETISIAAKIVSAPSTSKLGSIGLGPDNTNVVQTNAAYSWFYLTDSSAGVIGTAGAADFDQASGVTLASNTSVVGGFVNGTSTQGDVVAAGSARGGVAATAINLATSATTTTLTVTGYLTVKPDVAGDYTVLVSADDNLDADGAHYSFVSGDPSTSFTFSTSGAPTTATIAAVDGSGSTSSSGSWGSLMKVTFKDAAGNAAALGGDETFTVTASSGNLAKATRSGNAFTSVAPSSATSISFGAADLHNGVGYFNAKAAASTTVTLSGSGSAALSSAVVASTSYTTGVAADAAGNAFAGRGGTSVTTGWDSATSNAATTISSTATSATLELTQTISTDEYGYITVTDDLGKISGSGAGALKYDKRYTITAALDYVTVSVGLTSACGVIGTCFTVADSGGATIGTAGAIAAAAPAVSLTTFTAPVTSGTIKMATAGSISITARCQDQFRNNLANTELTLTPSGRNSAQTATKVVTGSTGRSTFTFTDTGTSGASDTLTVSGCSTAAALTVSYGSTTAGSVLLVTPNTTSLGVDEYPVDAEDIAAGDGAEGGVVTVTATVKDAAGVVMAGLPVTFTVSGTTAAVTSTTQTVYTGAAGTASASVYAWVAGTYTVTATAGGASDTAPVIFAQETDDEARTIEGSVSGNRVTATVKDRFGNVVTSGVNVVATVTAGSGVLGSATSATAATNTDGQVTFVISGSGASTVKLAFESTTFGQTDAPKGNVSSPTATDTFTATTAGTATTAEAGVGASFDAAGVNSVTVEVTGSDSATAAGNAATAAAEAATDAAAEAIDAANAATDAANLAAEAADAATVAAEEARDAADAATAAVEELATQVATLMAALKAQITTLANTVAKIAKKVKA